MPNSPNAEVDRGGGRLAKNETKGNKGIKVMIQSKGIWRRTPMMALGGGLAFWVVNLAISLTPIAAEYRAALSISYFPMLLEALLGGLIIGFCVSYFLLRFFDKIPTENPILKSVTLSSVVFIIVTALIEVPAKFVTTTPDALRYFLIGTTFNGLRILALGVAIGYLYGRFYKRERSKAAAGTRGI
jgi:branched-subunit amino acid ABC-type transport system permease component